jgi:hypothetical protein
VTIKSDPLWIGVGFRAGNLNGPLVPNSGHYDMAVDATGPVFGSIKRIERVLRDREAGTLLGSKVQDGPFPVGGNTPCRGIDPLLAYGHQSFFYNDDLGFVGRPATLRTEVTITDAHGVSQTLTTTSSWQLLPAPTVTSPVRTVVRQNDPASGCAFDPVHGYGLVVDVSWNPPPGVVPVTGYYVDVIDGNGKDVTGRITFTSLTTARTTMCDAHVPLGAEHARVGVAAGVVSSYAVSAWAIADFDFQSCRQAGTPACQ